MATVKELEKRVNTMEVNQQKQTEMLESIMAMLTNGKVETKKGSGEKKENTLTKEQKEIVKKYKPNHRLGTDKGSIHYCVRQCAYEFCGGKAKYNEELYNKGKMAWFKEYDKDFRNKLKDNK